MNGAEINRKQGGLLIVGRDYGETEEQMGLPFQGKAGSLLNMMLEQAGIDRGDCNITNVVNARPKGNNFQQHSNAAIQRGLKELDALIYNTRPDAIIALGNEAAWATIPDWPGDTIRKANGIEDRRGYVFESRWQGVMVVPTIHPAAVLRMWTPWRVLVPWDLMKANGNLARPQRKVVEVGDSTLHLARNAIDRAELVACDIEIFSSDALACIGFAPSEGTAYVFGPSHFQYAFDILRSGKKFVFANGQFDLHFLAYRYGVEVNEFAEDTQLAWHSCYPELAGKGDFGGSQATRKSLSFLASLFTNDVWWKDYEFQNEWDRYYLNGIDCCVTLSVINRLLPMIKALGVEKIYELEKSMVWPAVDMQGRGLKVNEKLMDAVVDQLTLRYEAANKTLTKIALPRIVEAIKKGKVSKPHLFEDTWTCPCCGNGKVKKAKCWECEGFESKPSKADLLAKWPHATGTKAEIEQRYLGHCRKCAGKGQEVRYVFKSNSDQQHKILLYEVLGFKKRMKKGKLRTDESVLKDMLGEAKPGPQQEIISAILNAQKLRSMLGHYERLRPGDDGRIRTVLSPSGTNTGRLSSKATFIDVSTNLQNLPKKTAMEDPLYEVRRVIVPDYNRVLCEADYSSAERRLLAYLAGDRKAQYQISNGINTYKWFAAKLFGVKDWESIAKSSPMYHIGKMSVLALDRGVSWRKLKEQINKSADLTGASVTAKQAKKAEILFHNEFPRYRAFHKEVGDEIARKGYLVNVAGRRREFFGRRSSESQRAEMTRQGVSFLAQAVGDIINERLVEIYEQYDPHELRVLLQIHDAILFDTFKSNVQIACNLVRSTMEKPITLPSGQQIVIPVEIQASNSSWGEMKDV